MNSKNKGNRNEIRACKWFEKWTGYKFHRTPASGGLRWQKDSRISGDIVPPVDMYFPLCVEVKSRKTLAIEEGTLRKNSIVYKFFTQATNDSKRVGKLPILFMREDYMKSEDWFVATTEPLTSMLLSSINLIAIGHTNIDNTDLTISIFNSEDIMTKIIYTDLCYEIKRINPEII